MNETNDLNSNVRAVKRASDILRCFSNEDYELTLGQISERVNLAKSTVHRILNSLEESFLIEQNADNGKYHLGFEVIRLGRIASENIELSKIARPEMIWLSEKCGQTSNLYIMQENQRLCTMQVPGKQYIRRFSYIGAILPLYVGASGKIFLAYRDEKWLEEYLTGIKLERFTENTITDKDMLIKELKIIKKQGFAVSSSERDPISASIAAPIFDYNGEMTACLTISGPSAIFTDQSMQSYLPTLLEAAKGISFKLGYQSLNTFI